MYTDYLLLTVQQHQNQNTIAKYLKLYSIS